MVLSKKLKINLYALVLFFCSTVGQSFSQSVEPEIAPPPTNEEIASEDYYDPQVDIQPEKKTEPIWQDEQWLKAKEGIKYVPEKTEENKEEPIDEAFQEENSESDFGKWLMQLITSTTGKLIAILVIVALLTYMIIRLVSNGKLNGRQKIEHSDIFFLENADTIPVESDLDRHLRLSLESFDYKSAVRILYLMVIRQLHEKELIKWQKNKTNRDYINELRSSNYHNGFREITLVYELVWYGDNSLSQSEYMRVEHLFKNYKTSFHEDEAKR
jgi:hypothetical protein